MNNRGVENSHDVATASAQLSSMQAKNGAANNSQEHNINLDVNHNINSMMQRRESIGVVNVLGDALFGRRQSFGFGGDMGGDIMSRRGSMDSVVDAAIQNLANRRLSMLGGSTHAAMNNNMNTSGGMGLSPLGMNSSMMGGGFGMMGMQSQGMNGMNGSVGMNHNNSNGATMSSQMNQFLMNGLGLNSMMSNNMAGSNDDGNSSKNGMNASNNTGNSDLSGNSNPRQKQLQEQRMELQRRQKELELQRQQLLSAMEERKHAMQQMQQTIQQEARQHQQADRRQSLFGGALGGFARPLLGTMPPSSEYEHTERRGSFGGLDLQQFENQWRQNGGMRDQRRGSLDLLGALAGATQEAETSNNMVPKNSNGDQASPSQVTSAMDEENFTIIKKPIPLGLKADKDWLTPLHCFVRLHCVEVFTATEMDVAIPTKGKRKPIRIGQVGIRCPHCHNSETGLASRERGSVYYPTSVSSIYNATMNLLQRHLHNCTSVKPEIMKRYETLKSDDARSGTSKKYWAESALSLGLVDTPIGIRFSSSEPPPLPSLTSEQKASDNYSASRGNDDLFFNSASNATKSDRLNGSNPDHSSKIDGSDGNKSSTNGSGTGDYGHSNDPSSAGDKSNGMQDTEKSLANSAPLVTPEDEKVATQFSFYLLGQMQMCVFTEADRLGKRKGLPPGFPGLACRHCFGGYGSGRFFPSSIKTLSDTSKTLNVLFNHMMRCRKCPQDVRNTLEKLRKVHDEQRAKMKFGSQKAFFARIWDRLHDNDPHVDSRKRKFNQPKKLKAKSPASASSRGPSAAERIMKMQGVGAHFGQQSHNPYLDAANAFTGNLGGLSTAGLLNGFGVSGMLSRNTNFDPSAQYRNGDSESNKRIRMV